MYPGCDVNYPFLVGDGSCDDGEYNTEKCGFDGGDCVVPMLVGSLESFLKKYPNCTADAAVFFLGNGKCDGVEYNNEQCGYDDGDCIEFNEKHPDCPVEDIDSIGDGTCESEYNTEGCGYDGGDCDKFNEMYPECKVDFPVYVGDGSCDGEKYNTEECGYDGGDCNPKANGGHKIGCGLFDGGDCTEFNEKYPNCLVQDINIIGDGTCESDYNTEECGYDGGDCDKFNEMYPECKVDFPVYVGDGSCDGDKYNTEECGYDGGDCDPIASDGQMIGLRINVIIIVAIIGIVL